MRISIRQQLVLLLLLSSLLGLSALAIATWIANNDFVLNVASTRLRTTAVLKAAQVAVNLELMRTTATFVTTRTILQRALQRYNEGSNTTLQNWDMAADDLKATLGNVGPVSNSLVLQTQIFARNISGPAGNLSVLNGTGVSASEIALPWHNPDSSPVLMGQPGLGYPPILYPNLTITTVVDNGTLRYIAECDGETLGIGSTLVLGPLQVNESFSMLSMTLPIVEITDQVDILGWVTVVSDARLIQLVQQDQRGLGKTGQTLLIGPVDTRNKFTPGILGSDAVANVHARYLLPLNHSFADRHPGRIMGTDNPPFAVSAFPAVERALKENNRGIDDVKSIVRSHNEARREVSVSYSVPPTDMVDWIVVVEQARSEVWEPIYHLRNIILVCLFAVVGFNLIMSWPMAHFAVLPILRLRAATEQTIDSPRSDPPSQGSSSSENGDGKSTTVIAHRNEDILEKFIKWRGKRSGGLRIEQREAQRFRIPGKVPERRAWVKDEMTDLVQTFNEMGDELYAQYSCLEERVRQRTTELEHSKKAAEAANESKTLFLANISHELKTPLNGILGMCAVSMEEDDHSRIQQSLKIIYKSGDLLLRTLSDLLTFSTNQVGLQVMKLEEKEFLLRDLESQIYAIFREQAKDQKIDLNVVFDELPDVVYGSKQLRDLPLWGDIHRILQIVINFTSNALKVTPPAGKVTVIVRAVSETPPPRMSSDKKGVSRRLSLQEKGASPSTSIQQRAEPGVLPETPGIGTANFINPREAPLVHSNMQERAQSPPPGLDVFIEFNVCDTGPGIAPAIQRRIFEPFVQGDAGLSRKYSGTGLGLSICSQLASLMRGTIALTSEVGSGSTFSVKIPLRHVYRAASTRISLERNGVASAGSSIVDRMSEGSLPSPSPASRALVGVPEAEPKVPVEEAVVEKPVLSTNPSSETTATRRCSRDMKAGKEAHPTFGHARILVAEDNKVNQEVILRMLKLEGIFDVTIAADGQEAFELAKTSPFDLVFMDCAMPFMDGLTCTRLMRQHGFERPIVALTAYAEQSNMEDCYGSGMNDFLTKPIKRPQLKKVLTRYFSPSSPRKHDTADGSTQDRQQKAEEANGSPISPDQATTVLRSGTI